MVLLFPHICRIRSGLFLCSSKQKTEVLPIVGKVGGKRTVHYFKTIMKTVEAQMMLESSLCSLIFIDVPADKTDVCESAEVS